MLNSIIPVVAAALLLGACNRRAAGHRAAGSAVRWRRRPMPPATVYFDSGSATLSQKATATIQQVAANYRTAAMPP